MFHSGKARVQGKLWGRKSLQDINLLPVIALHHQDQAKESKNHRSNSNQDRTCLCSLSSLPKDSSTRQDRVCIKMLRSDSQQHRKFPWGISKGKLLASRNSNQACMLTIH